MQPVALFFDIFGTVADWRSGVAREARRLLEPRGVTLDWLAFADAWRGQYQPGMEDVRSGRIPFSKLDVLHRRNLDRILPRFSLDDLDEATRAELNLAWRRLDGWPDSKPGLDRLRARFRLAPVSNGNISLMVDMARHNGFIWDAILGAEVAGDYKPKPRVYEAACDAMSLPPSRCMMVAAHSNDLAAARACGLQTAFIARPDEYGPGTGETQPLGEVDIVAGDLCDLARQLGV